MCRPASTAGTAQRNLSGLAAQRGIRPGSGRRSALVLWMEGGYETVARWHRGAQTVQFLIDRGRLESFEASHLATLADALIGRAELRLEATARAALKNGDVDGAYAAAYDAYRMAAEALLGRQGLRATGGDGSHMSVEDTVSAQFAVEIPAFAKPTFERLRRTRHTAQYFDPSAAPITEADAAWAIEKAAAALPGVKALLATATLERFV
jgi:hypothetical protein